MAVGTRFDDATNLGAPPPSTATTVVSKTGLKLIQRIKNTDNINDVPEIEAIPDINIKASRTITLRAYPCRGHTYATCTVLTEAILLVFLIATGCILENI